ncbi:tetratricopeptide repeat protein, partial [Candidatus Microgenomates bacterium]|nr:tetratricopeptide repeat protein [Candidatus Microgenomates bacterium]
MTRSIIRTADWQDEDTLLIAASRATPWSARARNNVGGVYVRHKDYAHAIEEFKASLALEPDYPEIEYNLANCYYLTGNRNEAIKYYLLALKHNPRLWRSHTNLGKMYMMSTKEYQKAIPHLKESLKNDPSDTTVQELLKVAQENKE